MPAYPGNALAKLLRDNTQAYLWDNELVAASGSNSLSLAFQLERINRSHYPWGLSFEVSFSGAPGVFEIDLMAANNDNGVPIPGNYVAIGLITSVNANNVGRWDMPSNIWCKYVAGYVKTLTNAVKITLQVTK